MNNLGHPPEGALTILCSNCARPPTIVPDFESKNRYIVRVGMSLDNPFDQVEALIASDERQQPPELVDAILKGMAKVPGVGRVVAAVRYESERQRIENSETVINTLWEEGKRVSSAINALQQESVNRDEVRRLILDAIHKAEDLRDRKRVERIGKILAHALTLGPDTNFDKAEEMMRVARDLSDQDVVGLRYLYDTQFVALQQNHLRINVDDINTIWREKVPINIEGVLQAEYISIFLKLQGLGLATLVERKQTQLPPNEQVFALLAKGADFVRYIQGAVSGLSTERAR